MINSIVKIRAPCKRGTCVAQKTGDRSMLLLEVSLLGMRLWLHKNTYNKVFQTPEIAKYLFPSENSVVEVTTLAMSACLTV